MRAMSLGSKTLLQGSGPVGNDYGAAVNGLSIIAAGPCRHAVRQVESSQRVVAVVTFSGRNCIALRSEHTNTCQEGS